MTAITKSWTDIADSAVDPDSPVTEGLVTGLRDNVIVMREWMGESFFAGRVQDHNHDGINSAGIEIGPNLLRNGSFESDLSGWTATPFSGGSVSSSTTSPQHGAKKAAVVSTVLANGGGELLSDAYVVVGGGETVSLKWWVLASVADVSSKFEIIWYDNTQAQISATTILQDTSTPTSGALYAALARAPDTARYFRLRLTGGVPSVGTATGTISFDGVQASTGIVNGADVLNPPPISLFKVGALNLAQATTAYMGALGRAADATESNVEVYVIRPFTMKELRAFASANVPASNSAVFTLRKNGADTALTCTIGAGAASADNLSNVIHFGFGDRFAIKCVSSATAGTNDYSATVRQSKLDTDIGFPVLQLAGTISASGSMGEVTKNVSIGGSVGYRIPLPKVLASDWISSFVNTKTATPRVRTNGAVQALDAEVATDTIRDSTEGLVFAEMDGLDVSTSGAFNGSGVVYLKSRDPAKYDPCPLAFTSTGQAQALTRYMGGYVNGVQSATEGECQIRVPACRIRNLRGQLSVTPPSGQTMTVTVRKNGVATGLTCQFNSGGAQATDLTHEATFAAGDKLSVEAVSSATLGTTDLTISLEMLSLVPA